MTAKGRTNWLFPLIKQSLRTRAPDLVPFTDDPRADGEVHAKSKAALPGFESRARKWPRGCKLLYGIDEHSEHGTHGACVLELGSSMLGVVCAYVRVERGGERCVVSVRYRSREQRCSRAERERRGDWITITAVVIRVDSCDVIPDELVHP